MNKLVPNLRFPQFAEELEWEEKKLGEVSDKIMYGMNAAATSFDGKHKYLRITDIDENTRQFIPNPLSSPNGNIEKKYKLHIGDIVFARTGASVGKSYLYKQQDGDLYFAGFLIKFSIKNVNANFVFYQTFKEKYNKWVNTMSMRSGQPGINAEEYKEFPILFPSLAEQTQIGNFLTAVDTRILLLKQKLELLKSYKKGIMAQIFSQELRFKDENGQEFPEWEEKTLGEVLIKNSTKNKAQKYSLVQSVSNKYGFVNQDELFEDRRIASKDTSNYYVIKKGFFAYNPSRIDVGSLAYKFDDEISIISPLYISFKAKNELLADKYLLNWFYSEQFTKQMNTSFEGSVRNTLSYENLIKIEISIPCLAEQTKIAEFLTAIDQKINYTEQQIAQSEEWKKGLLQQMLV